MATIILNHRVKDYSAWKEIYDLDIERRSNIGLKEIKVGVKSDDSDHVYVILETQQISAIEAFMSDPGLKEKMDQAGVIGPPEIVVVI